MYDIYMFLFNFFLNIYMLHNPRITCICPLITYICPLIQDVANISMSSYIIVNLTFLENWYNVSQSPATRCDTTPTPRHPTSCTFTQFTWSWPFRTPHHCPHIHDPLRTTVTPVLWILFCIRILSLTLRLRLGDGWVHWISYYGCRAQDMPCVNDVVYLGNGGI